MEAIGLERSIDTLFEEAKRGGNIIFKATDSDQNCDPIYVVERYRAPCEPLNATKESHCWSWNPPLVQSISAMDCIQCAVS